MTYDFLTPTLTCVSYRFHCATPTRLAFRIEISFFKKRVDIAVTRQFDDEIRTTKFEVHEEREASKEEAGRLATEYLKKVLRKEKDDVQND